VLGRAIASAIFIVAIVANIVVKIKIAIANFIIKIDVVRYLHSLRSSNLSEKSFHAA
jgi:hypothetical protein